MKTETIKQMPASRRLLDQVELKVRKGEGAEREITFAASSETPVERWYGKEVLSHEKGAVRLERARAGVMPLLFNHNSDDPIGVITGARVEGGRIMADAKLFDTQRARDVLSMIEGGLRNISIGYRSFVIEEDTRTETYTVTDWEPFEASVVSVPADPTVGIGRSHEQEYAVRFIRTDSTQPAPNAATSERSNMTTANAPAGVTADPVITAGEPPVPTPGALELEKARKRAIENLCKANKIDDKVREYWVGAGLSLEQVSDDLLSILEERGRTNPQSKAKLGLTEGETKQFSLARAITACLEKNWTQAGFELECSRAVAQRLNQVPNPNKFYVPFEVLQRSKEGRRDLTVATAGAGGYLVGTENMGFIEMLRNRSVAYRMGARQLGGLQGNVTIPRQSAAATAYWLANEATAITESQQTFVQVALTPKTVGAYTEISRQLLLQSSPAAEGIVSDDLAQTVAIAVDLAALEGSGAGGQPTGISNTAGIGSVTGTSLAAAGIIEFMTDVAGSNVTPLSPGYVTTPAVAGLLMARPELPSTGTTRLWNGNLWDGSLFNLRALTSNQLTAATMIFGDWSELVIGEWGVLEVEVNPFANFQAGIVGVRAMYTLDCAVRRPFAFSRATSIT